EEYGSDSERPPAIIADEEDDEKVCVHVEKPAIQPEDEEFMRQLDRMLAEHVKTSGQKWLGRFLGKVHGRIKLQVLGGSTAIGGGSEPLSGHDGAGGGSKSIPATNLFWRERSAKRSSSLWPGPPPPSPPSGLDLLGGPTQIEAGGEGDDERCQLPTDKVA
ncbi:unnamed protein product, partial [Nippostrongylus brasiliensis]|uniref:PIPK domain-containing protein n=1 Tax=Nippostrongylus brasiliensis TaxID=27835 RepID=A0A0N4XIX9_NIPBR